MDRIGPYEVVRELGRGATGVVYAARSPSLDRLVAIKVLQAGADATDEERERFEAEARAAARLRHPGIVGVHETGEHGDAPYLVMDLLEGETLAARVGREGPLDAREAARLTCALAEALAYAHGLGVLHRDVKPQNVLVGKTGQPVLADFGVAKDLRRAGATSRTGEPIGTPAYMSPEQARGDRGRVDARSDVYGLGATLYELLAGRAPFVGESAAQLLDSALNFEPPPLRKLRRGLDPDLVTICGRCLEKDPAARYASAHELALDLQRFLAHESIQARPPGPVERARKWTLRNRAVAGALGGVATLALALGLAGTAAFVVELRRERDRAVGEEQRARDLAARAGDRARLANQALDALVSRVSKQLRDVPGDRVRAVRQRLLVHALDGLERLRDLEAADAPRAPATVEAHLQVAELALAAGSTERAERASAAALEAARALDGDGHDTARHLVRALDVAGEVRQTRGDLPGALACFQEQVDVCRASHAAATSPRMTAIDGRNLALALRRVADVRQRQGDLTGTLLAVEEAAALLVDLERGGDAEAARDLVLVWLRLAQTLEQQGALERAAQVLAQALPRQRQAIEQLDDPVVGRRVLVNVLLDLGRVRRNLGEVTSALEPLQEAIAIGRSLLAKDPANTPLASDLAVSLTHAGDALRMTGDVRGALAAFEEALALQRRAVANDPGAARERGRLGTTLTNLADVREVLGDIAGSSRDYAEATTIFEELVALDRTDAAFRRTLSMAQARSADLAGMRGDLAAQVAACDSSLALRRELVDLEPTSLDARHDLARALLRAGEARAAQRGLTAGLERWQEAVAVCREALKTAPSHVNLQLTFAGALDRAGDAHQMQSELEAAQAVFEEALAVRRGVMTRGEGSAIVRHDLAVSYTKLADLKVHLEEWPGALERFAQGELILRDLLVADGGSAATRRDLAALLERQGTAYKGSKKLAFARASLEESLALRRAVSAEAPESVTAATDVSYSLVRLAEVELASEGGPEALALIEEALALCRDLRRRDPGNARLMQHLSATLDMAGDTRGVTGDVKGAVDAYDESVQLSRDLLKLTPRAATAWRDLGLGLTRAGYAHGQSGDREGAVTRLREAVKIFQKLAERLPRLRRELEWAQNTLAEAEALPAD